MVHKYCATDNQILIRQLKKEDIEYLRNWRNDKELSKYLRSIPYISQKQQIEWFENYLDDTSICFFAIVDLKKENVIGSMAIYNIIDKKCEIGKIVIGDACARGKGLGYKAMLLTMLIAIEFIGIETFHLDVHEDNLPAKSIYNKLGYYKTGERVFAAGGKELEMEITKSRFLMSNPSYRFASTFIDNS